MELDIYLKEIIQTTVYSDSITHNVVPMAQKAGIYRMVWRPEEAGISVAKELIDPLEKAVKDMINNRGDYVALSPANSLVSYEEFLGFLVRLADNCKRNPQASVTASR